MHEPMMPEAEAKRRAREAFELGKREATAELSADLRALAQLFADELHGLRQELRQALGKPPLPKYCDCSDDTLQ